MTILEKAKVIRNLYNQWLEASRNEAGYDHQLWQLCEELEKATYKKNGYEHFSVFGAWLNKEEVERQRQYLEEKHERQYNRMKRIEEKLEQLLTEKKEVEVNV